MGFGRGLLLWLLGIPLPIIILLALFWRWLRFADDTLAAESLDAASAPRRW